jgi:hypothetical protein
MKREEIEATLCHELEQRRKKVLNRNAIDALFGAFENPVGALGKIFVGRRDALEREQDSIRQELVLDLLCRIDEALTEAQQKAQRSGIKWTEVSGKIEAIGVDTDEITGVRITSDAGPVEFKPGTHIVVSATGARRVVGLDIGGGKKGGL